MNGTPDPDLICANLAAPGSTFCAACIVTTGPAWQRETAHFDLNGECGRCRYFCLKSRYELPRYAREDAPFTPAQICGACTVKDDQRGGGGGAPAFYWDMLTTDTGTANLLDPKRPDSGSLFLWADGYYPHDPADPKAKTQASGFHFRNTVCSQTPIRDTRSSCHPLTGVPCLRLGPRRCQRRRGRPHGTARCGTQSSRSSRSIWRRSCRTRSAKNSR